MSGLPTHRPVSPNAESFPVQKMLMNDTMLDATRLTRANRLIEATALIQRVLRGQTDQGDSTVFDRNFGADTRPVSALENPLKFAWGLQNPTDAFQHYSTPGLKTWTRSERFTATDVVPAGGSFIEARYANTAGSRAYKLYIPSGYKGQRLPLIIMLHGGTQTADDFAGGTRMNVYAEDENCLVAYPVQPPQANPCKCWNWFRPEDQCRGRGEPSLVAGITQQIMKDYSVDRERVYVAGFSAGGAAAVVLAATYPDLYAAIGVHSGLPYGAAEDVVSAFSAMRQGDPLKQFVGSETMGVREERMPAIVFHGDVDNIVHPRNSEGIASSVKQSASCTDVHRDRVNNGREYTCTRHLDHNGRPVHECWTVHGAGHAWSGGHPAGSYTDPKGPDATKQMLRFFRGHLLQSD